MSVQHHAVPGDATQAARPRVDEQGDTPDVLYAVRDHVATITLNRPRSLNALLPSMSHTIVHRLGQAEKDDSVRVVVITGAGDCFSAGGDIKHMKGPDSGDGFEKQVEDLLEMSSAVKALYDFPKVTVASIRGVAVGAGLCLALACDFRLATLSARFSTAFAKIGLSGDFGGTFLLSRLIGVARARELFLTGETITGRRALEIGMLSEAYEDAAFDARVEAVVADLARGSTSAQWGIKKNFRALEAGAFNQSLEFEAFNQIRAVSSPDHGHAIRAFVEKREISFGAR